MAKPMPMVAPVIRECGCHRLKPLQTCRWPAHRDGRLWGDNINSMRMKAVVEFMKNHHLLYVRFEVRSGSSAGFPPQCLASM